MGTVWLAHNSVLDIDVALKLIRFDQFANDPKRIMRRLLQEARAAARLEHPAIVRVFDFGLASAGTPYIVMELLRGETLENMINTRGPLSPAYACELFLQVLAGLSAAHAQGIVHCDLKPANVLVTHPRPDRPLIKVLDFGVARGVEAASQTDQVVMGTPMYMAPEQVTGDPVDFRTDVYQACAMLFAMLAGQDPFEAYTTRDVMKLVAKGHCKDLQQLVPDLPEELARVIKDGMRVKRKERIQSAEELAERLRPFVTSGHFVSLVPVHRTGSGKPLPLIVGPDADANHAAKPPRPPASVIPVHMPSPRVTDSLLVSPRIPRAPSTPKLRMGHDFMPLPGDPDYQQMVEARRSQTHMPRRRSSIGQGLAPALIATGVGFSLGILLAWSAGLL
jgi:serine/threonine-protein kinase